MNVYFVISLSYFIAFFFKGCVFLLESHLAGTMCYTSLKGLNIQETSAGLWQAVSSWPGS